MRGSFMDNVRPVLAEWKRTVSFCILQNVRRRSRSIGLDCVYVCGYVTSGATSSRNAFGRLLQHSLNKTFVPFFIPSTSFCSLSSWFTSSCGYHLITVTTFALITYHSSPFRTRLKNSSLSQILSSIVFLFLPDCLHLQPLPNKVGTGVCFVLVSSSSFIFYFFLRVLD